MCSVYDCAWPLITVRIHTRKRADWTQCAQLWIQPIRRVKIAKIPRATAPCDAKHSQVGTKNRGCAGGEGRRSRREKRMDRMTHDRANLRVAVVPRSSSSMGVGKGAQL